MAVWQFSLHLIPRPKLLERFHEIPACMDSDLWQSGETEWWDSRELPGGCATLLDEVLPRIDDHWCRTARAWGSYDGDIVQVFYENGVVESIYVRINVREV